MPRFKNYRNKYTKNNIIHTTDDLMKMTLHEMSRREPELKSQYKQIGLPTTADMHNSSNVVYVNAYTRADGTQVSAHWRSKGEGSIAPTNLPDSQTPPINETPPVIMDEKYPDYPIEEINDRELKPGTALPPDEVTYDEDGNVVISGRVYYPNNDDGYENVENPSPNHLPTKAPDGPVEQPDGDNNGGIWGKVGDVLGGLGGVLGAALGFLPNILSLIYGSNGNTNTTVSEPQSVTLPNITPRQIKPVKFENIDNIENVNNLDFSNNNSVIKPLEPLSANKNITHFTPKTQQVISYNNSAQRGKMIPEGKAIDIKPQELNYIAPKYQDSKPIHLPSATTNPLSQGTTEYMNSLLKPSKDFGKGVIQGTGSLGTGLGKRYTNKLREVIGKQPLSQDQIDNIYAKVVGNSEQTGASKTGHIIGEIIPFLIMPSVSVAEFPMITNLLLTALYQSFIDSATHSVIDNGISKRLIPDVIKGVALALLNTLLAHGLLKNVDKSKLLKELETRLQKLFNELAEGFAKPIRQSDGSIVLRKAGKHHNSYTITEEIQNKINKAKNKPIKAVKIPSEDMGAIHHNIETYGFTDAEITDGYAARFSAYYGVIVKIYNGSFDDLHYVIIMKWRLK